VFALALLSHCSVDVGVVNVRLLCGIIPIWAGHGLEELEMQDRCVLWMEPTWHRERERAEDVTYGCTSGLQAHGETKQADSVFLGGADYSAGGQRVSSSQLSVRTAKARSITATLGACLLVSTSIIMVFSGHH
jgi:hypothetical protein